MKNVIAAVLVAVLLTSGLLAGCAGVLSGSGNLDTQEFNFIDFARVEVGYAFEVEIAQSSSYSTSITADDNLFDYIVVSKQGTTLKIRLKPALHYAFTKLQAKITMPQLDSLELSGATRGTVSGFSSTENMDIKVSGASSLNLVEMSAGDVEFDLSGASRVTGDITANDADFTVSGASTVQLEGSASDIVVDASGASHVKLTAFPVNNADVTLSGASSGTVNLDGRLDADLSGASKLLYIGEPTMGTINTSGASTLSKQ
jgi:hypothetical protein